MPKGTKRSLFSLYLAYFADYLSWGVAIGFLAVYITTDTSPFTDLFWPPQVALGIAFAAFPVGELIGSPILGDLSDWVGRKRVLIWGFWGSILSMLICAYALWIGSFLLFLGAQILTGFFSGKQGMAQAAIVDHEAGTKGQKLALLSVIAAVSWIAGPFLGEFLMKEPFLFYGGYIWPSLFASAIYFFSLLTTQWFFLDTYQPANLKLDISKFLHSMADVFNFTWKERLFFIFFLSLLGWYLMTVTLSNLLLEHFTLSAPQPGLYGNYFSFYFTTVGIVATAWILRRYRAKNILFWSLLVGGSALFLLYHSDRIVEFWTYLAIPAITDAWVYPAYQAVLADHTNKQYHGKVLGLIGAVNGGCQLIASFILAGISGVQCILIAVVLFLCSGALLPGLLKKKKEA